ncbi:hypothetical protein BOX15_Mlig033471g1, partial [Macrostomum lignano]
KYQWKNKNRILSQQNQTAVEASMAAFRQPQSSPVIRDIQVRHLASLTSGSGQLSPDEGLQRLRQMELSSGTQCRIRLLGNGGGLRVIDPASGQVMEDFPVRNLRQPLAYEGGRDNLLMFSVESDGGTWEMHIFQLPSALQASQIAQEMHQLIQQFFGSGLGGGGRGGGTNGEAADSSQLVQVLNRCLEEVEAFSLRIQQQQPQPQHPATPRSHRSERHSPPHQALPSTEDFVDILKKLKLALNLLGRLEGRIHQPNAPELVHCLFVPLVLIVQSIGPDLPSRVLSPLLTPAAVALLKHCLTSKECELWYSLGNAWTCHRQRWIDEHQQQAGDVPPYRPRFKRDGWQPELEPELLGQGLSKSQAAAPMVNGGAAPRQQPVIKINPVTMAQPHSPYSRGGNNGPKVQPSQPQRPVAQVAPRGPQLAQPSIYAQPRQSSFGVGHRQAARRSFNGAGFGAASSWDERQERLRSEAESRGRRVVQVLHDKAGRNAKELTVQRGELLEVLDDSRNWWQLRNYIGEVGHVPYTILRLL